MSASIATAAAAALVALASNPLTIFAGSAIVLGGLYLRFIKGTARQELVDSAIERAFFVVEDMKAQGKLPTYANKPVEALEQLRVMLKAHGLTVTSGIEDLARATWSAMHAPANTVSTVTATAPAGFKATAEVEPDTNKPSARRMGFIGRAKTTLAALGVIAFCLPSSGCVTAWTAAEKAAPACYGISAQFPVIEKQVSDCVTDATKADWISCAETAITDYGADKQLALCIYQAVALEIANPNGGEAPYMPDAGSTSPTDAGVDVAANLPLERAAALSVDKQGALQKLQVLQFRAQNGAVR